jgi:16S rRNA (uracil1498-N3)-methyltransferase
VLTPRFHLTFPLSPGAEGQPIVLPAAAAHHATRVLRLGVGAELALFDGCGGEYAATLTQIDKRGAVARVDRYTPIERESPLLVTLVQALAASDAMDYAVRKATELGVAAIQPLRAARSGPLPPGERSEKRLLHWQEIVIAACEQCGRNRVPRVAPLRSFAEWLSSAPLPGFVLNVDGGSALARLPRPAGAFAIIVGPEGGFTAGEVAAAEAAGVVPITLGPRVLRTETAGVAALAALQALWGDG